MLLGVRVWRREKTFKIFCSLLQTDREIAQSRLHGQPSAFFSEVVSEGIQA